MNAIKAHCIHAWNSQTVGPQKMGKQIHTNVLTFEITLFLLCEAKYHDN